MSREVEERVVKMTFENAQFEKAAKESLETVDRIKKETDLSGAAKAISNSGMVEAVQRIESAFTSFGGILKRKIFDQLANQAISTAKRVFRELEVEPIQQGFNEYELKMGSVQTIMASTGEELSTVNGYLEELNKYADRTIYSFSDMTNNIGKFTNAGVKLEDAVAAIQGISNEAALSGANSNEASRAMYNFAQALSSGAVRLIDWKSIENANMATVEFKEELIKTAEELGTVEKQADGTYKATTAATKKTFNATTGFNDALQDQWMTSDVLIKTLARYSDETTDLGKRAYAAAQDVKTFTQLMDTLKEAAGSGWAQTWEIIFGDFNEAKALWTSVSNAIGGLIEQQSESRNAMLQQWKDLGGRTLLIQALADAFETLRGFVTAATEGFKQFFPSLTGERLFDWTEKFSNFMKKVREAIPFVHEAGTEIEGEGDAIYKVTKSHYKYTGVLEKVYRIFGAVGAVAKIVTKGIGAIASLFFKLVKFALPGGEGILGWIADIGDRISGVKDDLIKTDFFGRWSKKVEDAVAPVGDKVKALGGKFKDLFATIRSWFGDTGLKDAFLSGMRTFGEDFINLIPSIITGITDFISGIIEFVKANETLQSIAGTIKDLIGNVIDAAPVLYGDVQGFVKGLFGFGEDSDSLSSRFNKLGESINGFVKELHGYDENGASILDNFINDMFPALAKTEEKSQDQITNPILDFVDRVTALVGDVKDAFRQLGESIMGGIDWFVSKWEEYNIDSVINKAFGLWAGGKFFGLLGSFSMLNRSLSKGIGGFGTVFEALVRNIDKTGDGAKGVFGSVADVFKGFWENMTGMSKDWTDLFRKKDTPATALLKAAVALAILVAAIYVLTKIDGEDFKGAAKKLGILAAGLLVFTAIFNKLSRNVTIKDIGSQLTKMGLGLILMVAALALIGKMNIDTLKQGIIGLGLVMIELGGFFRLTKGGGFAKDAAPRFISLALSLLCITQVLKQLGKMDTGSLEQGLIGLFFVLLELGAFSKFAAKSSFSKTKDSKSQTGIVSFLGLAVTLLGVVKVLKELAKMQPEDLVKSIIALGGILLELGIFSRLASKEFGWKQGIGLAGLAVSLLAFVHVMKKISKMKVGDLAKGLIVIKSLMKTIQKTTKSMGSGVSIGKAFGALILIVGSLVAFIIALDKLKNYDMDQMLAFGISFGALMSGLGKTFDGLSKLKSAGQILTRGGALAVLVAAVIGIGGLLHMLDEHMGGDVTNFLSGSKDILTKVGEALGGFLDGLFGGLIDTSLSSIESHLPSLGTAFGAFISNSGDFFTKVKELANSDYLTGATNLAGAIAAIGAAGIIDAIARLLNKGTSDKTYADNLADVLSSLASGINGFVKNIDGVSEEKVKDAAGAAQALADFSIGLPAIGGNLQKWVGRKDLADFAVRLPLLGAAIALFAFLTSGVDEAKIESVALSAMFLTELQKDLPASGGWKQTILGEQDLGKFSSNLSTFGWAVASMSFAMSFVSESNLNKATRALYALSPLANALPESSVFDFITGSDLDNFSEDLPTLGTAIGDFAIALSETGATPLQVSRATNAAKMLGDFAQYLPEQSVLELLTGLDDLSTFGNGIGALGTGLGTFAKETKDVDTDATTNAANAAAIISTFAQTELKNRSFGQVMAQFLTGESELEAFGSGMKSFGNGLANLYEGAASVKSWDVVGLAVTNLQALANMVKDFSESTWTAFEYAGEEFSAWDTSNIAAFLTKLTDFGTAPFEAGQTLAATVVNGAVVGLQNLPEAFRIAALGAGSELVNSAAEISKRMHIMGLAIGNNTINGFNTPSYYNAGINAFNGFINGLASSRNMQIAFNAGANLGISALNGLRSRQALNEHSPSKAFEDAGIFAGQGLENGLASMGSRIETTATSMGQAAVVGAKKALAYLYTVAESSMDLSPVIRPVIDTTGITTGAAQINGMLSGLHGFAATGSPYMASLGGFDNAEILARSNQNVVNAVQSLGARVDALGARIASMQMVTDTGKMVGEMREDIDTQLGVIALRKGRKN